MNSIFGDLEGEPVPEIELPSSLQVGEHFARPPDESQIDIPSRPRSFDPELQHDASLDDHALTKLLVHACEEAVEDQHLPEATDV
jgi:hypothetical protein